MLETVSACGGLGVGWLGLKIRIGVNRGMTHQIMLPNGGTLPWCAWHA